MTGCVVWFTGLPAAGKTTAAKALIARQKGASCLLDSDELRARVFGKLGYSDEDRDEFYRALGELAALLAQQGNLVVVAATANRRRYREHCRKRAPRFIEVLVDTDPQTCRERDYKKLYGVARDLPGQDAAYEPPHDPDIVLRGGLDDVGIARLEGMLLFEP